MLAAAPWDAMVLDLQLRHGTGLGVLRALISRRPPNTKVIVLTNYAFPQYRAKSMALGADYFFDKSREFHDILKTGTKILLAVEPPDLIGRQARC